jgi:hypothetical protein
MDILIPILFVVGFIEELIAILFYKTGQKNFDSICAVLCLIRGIIWIFVVTTLIKHTSDNIFIAMSYVVGCASGCYFSLKIEPTLEKFFKVLKKKGRRVKRWFLHNKRR